MYLSIDIETTGLDPEKHQILQVAGVLWDHQDVMKCSWFDFKIKWDQLTGSPFALNMNKDLLANMKHADYEIEALGDAVRSWLAGRGVKKVYPLGCNVGGFDMQFLKRVPGWPKELFSYRCLEVGTLYANALSIPSLSSVIKDHGLRVYAQRIPGKPHEALYDARLALLAASKKLKR